MSEKNKNQNNQMTAQAREPRNCWRFIAVLLAALLASTITYTIAQSFESPDIYLDDLPSERVSVKTDGTWFWSVDLNGDILGSPSSDFSLYMESILDNNTSLFLTRGDYAVASDITLSALENVTIASDWNAHLVSTVNDEVFIVSNCKNIKIQGLFIEGSYNASHTLQTAIQIQGSTNVVVENCKITRMGYDAINLLYGCSNCRVANNEISYSQDDGINPGGGGAKTRHTLVSGNSISNCTNDGVHLSSDSEFSVVSDNTIDGCGNGVGVYNSSNNVIEVNIITRCGYGVYVGIAGVCTRINIQGNLINGSTTDGILLGGGGDYSKVSENQIYNSSAYGIDHTGGLYCQFVGNTIVGGTRGYYTYLVPSYSLVSGNTVVDASAYGLVFSGSGSGFGIMNNNIVKGGCATAAIFLSASYNLIVGNSLYNVTGTTISDTGSGNTKEHNVP